MDTTPEIIRTLSGNLRPPTASPGSDVVFVRDFKVQTLIGVYPQERRALQTIRLDLDIGLSRAGGWTGDQLADTVDYGAVVHRIRDDLATCRFALLETLAEHVAELVLDEYDSDWVMVRVAKSAILPNVGEVGFCLRRERDLTRRDGTGPPLEDPCGVRPEDFAGPS